MKRITYNTMNSWNGSTAPAYNMKVYNVIPRQYQDKVYELLEADGFYDPINDLIEDFDRSNDYEYQAGFNGRSGGYLVLYKGGRKLSEYKSYCTNCGQRNYTEVTKDDCKCGNCGLDTRINHVFYDTYCYSGKSIDIKDVPVQVKKDFRKLATDIVHTTIDMAKNAEIKDVEYIKTKKVINY